MGLGSTQPVTETNTNILLGGGVKARPACKADSFTAICELIV
jgi:hypothetical protein